MKNRISVIICAAGKGERAGFSKNKLLAPLYGAPALYHTFEKFNIPAIDEVIVTSSERDFKEISALAAPFSYTVTLGGDTRTESVKKALKLVTGDIVLIHDGARPFVTEEIILNCIKSAEKYGSGVCAVKFTDTSVYSDNGLITDRLNRDRLYRIQTPQGFKTEDIRRAYSFVKEGESCYDDSEIYGKFISPPHIVEGGESNIKLTYKQDFSRGLPLFSPSAGVKAGFGVDVHAFGEGNFVTLAGVEIPCDGGLIAHSDGDVIIHAVMDALLSAAGMRDIGYYFPDSDESLRGANSICMLKQVCALMRGNGYAPANISVSVQAEKPRLSPYIDKMTENIAAACGLPESCVAVAAGTCEGLGFVGKSLGIAAYCSALIKGV